MRTICYLDMDDVLADLSGQAFKYLGVDFSPLKNKKFADMTDEEKQIQKKLFTYCDFDNCFWKTMPLRAGAKDLYEFCRREFDEVVLLSRFVPPQIHRSRLNATAFLKLKWAHEHFGSGHHLPKVIVTDKVKSVLVQGKPDLRQILVDDLVSNVQDWQNTGGIGILHVDTQQTLIKLQPFVRRSINLGQMRSNNHVNQ